MATGTMIVLGILTAIVALVALTKPTLRGTDELTALFGVLFFISPWVMGFDTHTGMAWTARVIGVIGDSGGEGRVPAHARARKLTAQSVT
jgi:hypothetical protein